MLHIAIIIVNWNSWDVLAICLDKLKKQSYKNYRVLVLDNASTELVSPSFLLHNSNVQIIQNDSNIGFAAANNQAIKLLVGVEWCILLNPDAFPEHDWLANLVDASIHYPEYSIFASRQVQANDEVYLDGDGDVYHISGLVWRKGYGKPRALGSTRVREVFSACAAAAMYRVDAFNAVGGFDEDFFCYVEDVDLGFRLRLAGYKCLLVPNAVVHHVGSASTGGGQSDFSIYYGHRNLVWAFVKNMPGFLFWILLPMHLLMNLVTILRFTITGQGKVIFRAKKDALIGLPKFWQKRQAIQKNRLVSLNELWHQFNIMINR